MKDPRYLLGEAERRVVLNAIVQVCDFRGWGLHAAHVPQNHVHIVADGESAPMTMLADFKAYASRALNGIDGRRRKRWTRGGSTRRILNDDAWLRAVRYVVSGQGSPMAVYGAGPERAT